MHETKHKINLLISNSCTNNTIIYIAGVMKTMERQALNNRKWDESGIKSVHDFSSPSKWGDIIFSSDYDGDFCASLQCSKFSVHHLQKVLTDRNNTYCLVSSLMDS